jgi:hypothetical protein
VKEKQHYYVGEALGSSATLTNVNFTNIEVLGSHSDDYKDCCLVRLVDR